MFNITDNERLRDAYALLMFIQSDVPASSEKKAAVKNLAATVKMEIREFNRRRGHWFAYHSVSIDV